MQNFKDKSGREWSIDLTDEALASIREAVRTNRGIELRSIDKLHTMLANDPELMGIVLWRLLEDQAEQRGIKPEDFAKELGREGITAAFKVLGEAWILRSVVSGVE